MFGDTSVDCNIFFSLCNYVGNKCWNFNWEDWDVWKELWEAVVHDPYWNPEVWCPFFPMGIIDSLLQLKKKWFLYCVCSYSVSCLDHKHPKLHSISFKAIFHLILFLQVEVIECDYNLEIVSIMLAYFALIEFDRCPTKYI